MTCITVFKLAKHFLLLVVDNVKPFSSQAVSASSNVAPVRIHQSDSNFVLENELVRVTIDKHGRIVSFILKDNK